MSSRLKFRLLPRAEAAIRRGHPWVFAASIKGQNRDGELGELAAVYDRRNRLLGLALYDPQSPIRLRVVQVGGGVAVDRAWWHQQARRARARRGAVIPARTTGHRWIHGENDGFPGLVADRYGETLAVKLYSGVWLPRWAEVESVLREVFEPRYLVLRTSRNLRDLAACCGLVEGPVGRPGPEWVEFEEHGLRFVAHVRHGQKTGFFLDQREHRARVEGLSRDAEVLNLFSFSGGFSLYAARGGARRVVDVDLSPHALAESRRHFALNALPAAVDHQTVQADIFRWLREVETRGAYDVVICDPPSLARREQDRAGAEAAYTRLNLGALQQLRRGGVLVSASCSAHVAAEAFFQLVLGAVRRGGREAHECWRGGHPPDHPATFPEAHYLKAICLRVE